MIASKDISVIVQGPIEWGTDGKDPRGITKTSMENIRAILPDAELILSTWTEQRVDTLPYDRVLFSKDPGPQGDWPSFVQNNVNRQIVSSVVGLKVATRPFCLKIRTDVVLRGTDFIGAYEASNPIEDDSRRIFTRPVLTNNFSSRNTESILERLPDHPLPFHPSDHVTFGLRDDVLSFWDVPLQDDEDAWYFMDRTYPNRFRLNEFSRLTPEQYIFTNAITKKAVVDILHYADIRAEVIELSEYYMNTHFLSVPDRLFPLWFPKYHTPHHFSYEWMRRNPDPQTLYKTPEQLAGNPNFTLGKKLTYPFRRPKRFARYLGQWLGLKV